MNLYYNDTTNSKLWGLGENKPSKKDRQVRGSHTPFHDRGPNNNSIV